MLRVRQARRCRSAPWCRRVHLRRGDRAAELARRAARAAPAPPPVPGRRGPLREPHRGEQRRDTDERPRHHHARRRVVPRGRHREVARHEDAHAQRQGRASRELRDRAGHAVLARSSRSSAAACSAGGRSRRWTPGGSSTPLLTAAHVDAGLDYESLAAAGSLLGTAAIMVLDETDCVVDCAQRMVAFYAHESCGKCTPCREGTWWATRVLERLEDGYGRREDLAAHARHGDEHPVPRVLRAGRRHGERHQLLARSTSPTSTRSTCGWVGARCARTPAEVLGVERRSGHPDDRRQRGHRPEGHADHPRRRAGRGRDPAVLRSPATWSPRAPAASATSRSRGSRSWRPRAPSPVAPGMVVSTQNTNDAVRQAQVANLEFLLAEPPAGLSGL